MKILFVPLIGLDTSLLERLAASVDHPIEHKIALNNGPEGALEQFANEHPDWSVIEPPCGNLGVAGGWNHAAKLFPNESIFVMNEDSWLLPGYLERICQCADANPTAPVIYLNDSHAYYAFVWTAAGREQFGTFDENLYVAYLEDCDYRLRMRLSGVTQFPYALQGLPPLPHGKPRTGGVNYSALIQGCGLFNRAYWRQKWGSDNTEGSLYQHPYNDHRLGVKDWVWYPELRAKIRPLWETFLSQPHPSIYE